ncbi:MAG: glycosyltransferase family 39 protein [Candidatus Xenobia bacterium]
MKKAWFALLAVAAVGLRVGLFVLLPQSLFGDAWHHLMIARNLMAGHGFSHGSTPPYQPDGQRSPLYPLLLLPVVAASDHPVPWMVLLQSLMDLVTAAVLWSRTRKLFGDRAAGWAAVLFLFAPYEAMYATALLTETTATMLVALWAEAGLRTFEGSVPRVAGGVSFGLLGGMVVLCRPSLALLVLAGCIGLATRPAWREAVLACVCAGLLCLPWMVRNLQVWGSPTPAAGASYGVTLWLGVSEDSPFAFNRDGGKEFMRFIAQWTDPADVPASEVAALDRTLRADAEHSIAADPGAYARVVLYHTVQLWWDATDGIHRPARGVPREMASSGRLVLAWCQRLLVLLAYGGLVRYRHVRAVRILACGLLVLTLSYAWIHVEGRFVLPLEPELAVLAALAVVPTDSPSGSVPVSAPVR